jgi:hypothetical protein
MSKSENVTAVQKDKSICVVVGQIVCFGFKLMINLLVHKSFSSELMDCSERNLNCKKIISV